MGSILVNGKFAVQRITGVQRYATEITGILHQRIKIIKPSGNSIIEQGHAWEQFVLPCMIKSGDLLWSPANTGPWLITNQIVTIHDFSVIDHSEWFKKRFSIWYQLLIPQLCKRVKKIITDSEFSRSRIIDKTNLPESSVVTIHLGVGKQFHHTPSVQLNEIRRKYSLNHPYLINVGSLEPRKNLPRLFQAWKKITRLYPDLNLVIVGTKGYPFQDPSLGDIPGTVKFLGSIPDIDLPALYSGAIALVYPSIYEGFGLPILEAMACGTPVLASSTTSLPEVVGNAGILFDPYQVDDIADSIEKILTDSQLQIELKHKGLQRAREFTWEKTAEGVWDVLQNTLEEIQR